MTEPTRDEINRALAEWEGLEIDGRYHHGFTQERKCFRCGGEPTEELIRSPCLAPIPDYVESLDAQMPLWGRLENRGYNAAIWIIGAVDVTGPSTLRIPAFMFPPAEASARALYAIQQEGE